MSTSVLRVKAAPGLLVMRAGGTRRDQIGPEPVEVDDHPYYQRRLADGSLILCPAPEVPATVPEIATDTSAAPKRGRRQEG